MTLFKRLVWACLVAVILVATLGTLALQSPMKARQSVQAAGWPPAGPNRKASIKVAYTLYEWWLLYWRDSQVACQVYIEHEGLPATGEILYFCGQEITNQWLRTPPCTLGGEITSRTQCAGLYLHKAHTTPGTRTIEVALAPPKVWLSISGCDLKPPQNQCDSLPKLKLTGEEPLPNEQIIQIQGVINGEAFNCAGAECELPLPPTESNGVPVEFWANSSYGDTSELFTAQVRAVPWGNFTAPEGQSSDKPAWYVDVLSSQWRGSGNMTCAQTWNAFPELGGPPLWLTTPDQPEGLKSSAMYYFLAGSLIKQGQVDAKSCADGGLLPSGAANTCGMEKARPLVMDWQNRFDTEIIRVAKESGVPGLLMKNVFSRESQLWPGMFATYKEAGLGQLTENGADTLLLWNPDFYSQFCPLVFETRVCQRGFGNLSPKEQAILRGALVNKVNAACPDCPAGIDLSQANFSISVFARSLLANCEQVGQILFNATDKDPGLVSTYTDLWRYTLVNYNAGAGCFIAAVQKTLRQQEPLDWGHVSASLDLACQGAIQYVDDVSVVTGAPTPTATSEATHPVVPTRNLTPQPSATVRPTITPVPTLGPSPTATPTGGFVPSATPTTEEYPYPSSGTETPSPTTEGYPYP